jgi:hypothetical protein
LGNGTCTTVVVGENSDDISFIEVEIKLSIDSREPSAMAYDLAVRSLHNPEAVTIIFA